MTSAGMPRDIDRILDAWFEEGPTLAADRVVGAALTQVEQVPQARPIWRGTSQRRADGHRMATWQLVAATIAIAITLVGIGFASGILRIERNPRPGPIESPDATTTASPSEATELVMHSDPVDGYELLLPRFWETDSRRVPRGQGTLPGVMTFSLGSGFGTRDAPGLTISVGQPDGSIFLCQPKCRRVVVSTLEELEAAISSRFEEAGDAAPPPPEVSGELQLGGEAGLFERPGYEQDPAHSDLGIGGMVWGGNCLGCPNMKYHAFTFHDGRPVVLAFDYWNIAFERLQTDYVARIIESFRFLD